VCCNLAALENHSHRSERADSNLDVKNRFLPMWQKLIGTVWAEGSAVGHLGAVEGGRLLTRSGTSSAFSLSIAPALKLPTLALTYRR